MRNKFYLFLIMMVGVYVYSPVFTQSAFAEQQTVTREQEERVLKILDRLAVHFFGKTGDITYSGLEVDEKENKIVVYDLLSKKGKSEDKNSKLTILNYQEKSEEDSFSIDQIAIRLEKMDANGRVKRAEGTVGLVFSDIEGEFKSGSLDIKKTQLVIIDGKSKKGRDLSGITFYMDDLEVTSFRELRKLVNFQKVIDDQLIRERSLSDSRLKEIVYNNIEEIVKNVSFKEAGIRDFPKQLEKDGKTVKLDQFAVKNFRNGVIEKIILSGLNVESPNDDKFQRGKVGEFSVEGIEVSRFIRIGLNSKHRKKGERPSLEEIEDILKVIKGVSVKDTELRGTAGFFGLKHFNFNWDRFVGIFPTRISTSGNFSLRPEELDEKDARFLDFLAALGIDIMNMKFDIRIEWDEKTNSIIIKPLMYDIDKIITVDFSASIANITKDLLLEKDPQKMLIFAMGANVGPVKLTIRDKGILTMLDDHARMRWDLMKEQFSMDPNLKPIIADLNSFLEKPEGTFQAIMKPKGPVNIAQLAAMGKLGPNAIFSLFDIKTVYLGSSKL